MEIINNLYNETVEVGKIQSNVSLIYSLIMGLFMCGVGIFIYKSLFKNENNDEYVDITAKIIKDDCKYYLTEKHGGRYSCNLQVLYEVDGKKYYGNVISDNTIQYKSGSEIIISYKKNDPNIIKIKVSNDIFYIIACMFVGIFFIGMIGSFYRYYMAHKYNAYSSIYGTGTAFGHGMRSAL